MGIIFGQLLDDLNKTGCEVDASDPAAVAAATGLTPGDIQDQVNKKVIQIVWMGCICFALIYLYIVSWSIFSRRLEDRLRDRYFRHMLHQDASFFDRRQAGELSSRLNADIQAVQSGTSEKVGIVIACVSFFLTSYIVAFIKVAKLAGMLVALIPAFTIAAAAGSFFTQKYSVAMSDAIAGASSIASETLSHIAVVQAFSAGPRLEAKFAARMGEAQKQGIKKAISTALQAGSLYFIAYSANALAYWQGSRIITETDLNDPNGTSVGEIYTVIFLLVDGMDQTFPSASNGKFPSFLTFHHSLHHSWLHCPYSSADWSCRGLLPEDPRRS
jgi:ATP-binding cassette, subfamily B (MDR/TAP), member 1